LAPQLTYAPAWAFASKGDLFVNSENSADMCRAIQAAGGRAAFTAFDGAKHDCWDLAVQDTGLVSWMLMQQRNPVAATARGPQYPGWGRLRAWNQ
jgi:hypothetical protein